MASAPRRAQKTVPDIGFACRRRRARLGCGVADEGRLARKDALDQVSRLVAFGPHPAGSEAIQKVQAAIIEKLTAAGISVDQDHFTSKTPAGQVAMDNITGRIPGQGGASQRTIILATHYDTNPKRTSASSALTMAAPAPAC